jgi:hypothetical protein
MVVYNIPTVARELRNNALLRTCIDKGLLSGLRLPDGTHYHGVTTDNLTDDYLHSLWLRIVATSSNTPTEPSYLTAVSAKLSTRLLKVASQFDTSADASHTFVLRTVVSRLRDRLLRGTLVYLRLFGTTFLLVQASGTALPGLSVATQQDPRCAPTFSPFRPRVGRARLPAYKGSRSLLRCLQARTGPFCCVLLALATW